MKDFEIRCDESRLETTNLIYGKFTLGPFLPGQATTFGNALRRSLLAELSGLAITAFEIIGVMQEFSTLPGLRESILDLSLNLKQIVLTGVLPYSTPPIGFLNVRGPAIIKAIDLKLPAGVYCASPNQYIATLGSNGMLHLKFVVSVGKGYSIQPYSIYRSLSKVKLQPASNFDNTTLGVKQKRDDARQASISPLGYEPFKDANLSMFNSQRNDISSYVQSKEAMAQPLKSSTPIPFEGKEYSKETPSFAKPPYPFGISKELYQNNVQSKEGMTKPVIPSEYERFPLTRFAKGPQRDIRENVSIVNNPRRENLQDTQSKEGTTKSLLRGQEQKDQNMADRSGLIKQRNIPSGYQQALPYVKNFPSGNQSTFFTNDCLQLDKKNSNSSYINIQTQLFQRITPHQVLPIDAVFTPVSQVNFLTEVNDRFETARENIVLEIWTNGSIHPKRALEEATLSLVQNFDTLLKKIQQASSFYKGLRYWTYLQPFKSNNGEKTNGLSMNSLDLPSSMQSKEGSSEGIYGRKKNFSYPEGVTRGNIVNGQKLAGESVAEKYTEVCKIDGSKSEKEDLLDFVEEKELLKKLVKKDLPQSIYNLDIGNLNLSLQTFIFLKKAKIHTLLQLLTQFSSKSLKQNGQNNSAHLFKNLEFNEKIGEELNNVIKQFGSED